MTGSEDEEAEADIKEEIGLDCCSEQFVVELHFACLLLCLYNIIKKKIRRQFGLDKNKPEIRLIDYQKHSTRNSFHSRQVPMQCIFPANMLLIDM